LKLAVSQYGFVLFFSAALPIAPLLALANNLVEVRSDALKMIYVTRRVPADDSASGIGPWQNALKLLSFAGIVVNLLYLGITTDFFEQLSHHVPSMRQSGPRVGALIAAEHILLLLRVVVDWLVPDVPDSVRIEMEREEFIDERREKVETEGTTQATGGVGSIGHAIASPIFGMVATMGSAIDEATRAIGHEATNFMGQAGSTIGNAFGAQGSEPRQSRPWSRPAVTPHPQGQAVFRL
jgi:anoctamin-8